jgi:serine/threonine protein kinase
MTQIRAIQKYVLVRGFICVSDSIQELARMTLMQLCAEMGSKHSFPLDILLSVLCDISNGMKAMHAQGFAHRDMNLGNFLITEDFVIKVLVTSYRLLPMQGE